MSGVQVTFGANIKPLVDGIDGVKSSIDDLRGYATSLAEAFGVAFSIDGVKNFVDGMAELGAKTVSIGAMLGASNKDVVELSGFATLTGSSIEQLSSEIERMSLNVQKATKDGTSPAAAALKVLHLNAGELIGLPAPEFFEKLSGAVSKFNPSLNLTNAAMELGGRGMAAMMPQLLKGGAAFEELRQKVQLASEGLAAAVPGMADTDEKIKLLSLSTQSLGARIFSVLKPAIDSAIEAFTRWVQSIKADDIRSVVLAIGNALINLAEQVELVFAGLGGDIDAFKDKLTLAMPSIQLTGFAASVVRFLQLKHLTVDALEDWWSKWHETIQVLGEPAKTDGVATVQQNVDKIHASADAARTALAGMFSAPGSGAAMAQDFLSIQQGVQDTITSFQKLNAAQINMGAGDALKAQVEQLQAMIKVADEQYRQTAEHLGAEAKLHEITYSQESAALLAALDARRAAEVTATDGELSLYARGTAGYNAVLKTRAEEDAKYFADRQKIVDQATEHEAQQWKSAADQISSAINGQLQKILTGHESLKQALANISGQIAMKFIEDQIKVTLEWLANQARILAAHLAAETGMTAATTAGSAARALAEVASGGASILGVIADAIRAIGASGGKTAAEVTAQAAPVAGAGALAIGAAAGALTVATGMSFIGGIAGAEIGGYVVRGGLVNVHDNETIVPARMNQPYQGGGAGGGDTHVHFNVSAMDGQSVQRFFSQNGNQIARSMQNRSQLNPSLGWA